MRMNIIWKGKLCEVIDLGTDEKGNSNGYRLYCEGLSKAREEHLIKHIGVPVLIQSRTNNQFDGALMLDFNPEDIDRVKSYFGVQNG